MEAIGLVVGTTKLELLPDALLAKIAPQSLLLQQNDTHAGAGTVAALKYALVNTATLWIFFFLYTVPLL